MGHIVADVPIGLSPTWHQEIKARNVPSYGYIVYKFRASFTYVKLIYYNIFIL
jgi:hypothetical protein